MSEEAPELSRNSTMIITAKEGEAFLDQIGKVDNDAKTRAQQKQIEEIDEETSPRIKRTTTMAETAKEGEALLDGADLGKTRSESAKQDEGEVQPETAEEEEKPTIQRAGTMEATAKEGALILEANGGVVDGTRSETKQVEEAIKTSEEEKVDGVEEAETNGDSGEPGKLKRKGTMQATAEEGAEFLKKQKYADTEEKAAVEA